jgi:pterin-4a-carbinolamine dehydratase
MQFGRLPVNTRRVELPVVPMDRWVKEGSPAHLTKTYKFRRQSDRNPFVLALMEYEEQVGHHARLTLDEDTVKVELLTRDIEQVTELDKEFAKYADDVYKDLAMRPD